MLAYAQIANALFFLLLFHLFRASLTQDWTRQCQINIKTGLHEKSPLMLDNQLTIYHPSQNSPSILTFRWFQDRLLYCPGSSVTLNNFILPLRPEQPYHLPPVVRCINGEIFELEASNPPVRIQLGQLTCQKPIETHDWLVGVNCHGGQVVSLGLALDPSLNLPTIKLCYVEATATTSWSWSVIPAGIAGRQSFPGKDFKKGVVFRDVRVNKYYRTCIQIKRFRKFFGGANANKLPTKDQMRELSQQERHEIERKDKELNEHVARYIRETGANRNYFVRGHLVARADKFYTPEQHTTYFFANVVPMWESINNGNWKLMEGQVRALPATLGELEVWVGGIGVLQIEGHDVYLGRNKRLGTPAVPAPKILYKLVASRARNLAVVFLAVNNPYLEPEELGHYQLCHEYTKCREIKPQFNDIYHGFMYCCLYRDFMASPEVQAMQLPIVFQDDVAPLL